MPDLILIIVNFNSSNYLNNCINSLKKTLKNIKYKILIIDNHSNGSDVKNITKQYSDLDLRELPENLGFGKANNLGVKLANAEYIALLNPDTIVIEDFISPLIEFIEKNENAGACAPMLLYEDMSYQSSTGPTMGIWFEFLEAFYLINTYRKIAKRKYLKNNSEPIEVGWVSGACMIVKRSVFESVGGFTEDYFLNYEDIDLCRKIEDAGYKNFYFPFLECIHLDHKSFDKNYELLVLSRYQSKIIYASIHYSAFTRVLSIIINIIGLVLRILSVNFLYRGNERTSRFSGYYKALQLYFGKSS